MAQVSYAKKRERKAREGTLSFFARGIRYRVSITDLCEIYGFEHANSQPRGLCFYRTLPALGHTGYIFFRSDISHPDGYPPPHPALLHEDPCQHSLVQDATQQGEDTGDHTSLLWGERVGRFERLMKIRRITSLTQSSYYCILSPWLPVRLYN